MSETTIPFQGGGTALLERPSPDLEPEPGGGQRNRTLLLALGGLAAVLVLGLVAYFLVFTGSSEEPAGPVTPPKSDAPAAPAVEEPAPVVKAPKINTKNFGRDPFKPLITEPVAAVDTAPVGAGTGTGTTDSTATAPSTVTSGGTSTAPTTTPPTASTSYSFKVVDVAPDNSAITVKVDGKVYRNLKAGEVFADYFKVVLISGQVNSFQFGEEKFNVIGTKKITIA